MKKHLMSVMSVAVAGVLAAGRVTQGETPAAAVTNAAARSGLVCDQAEFDFGSIQTGQVVSHPFTLRNAGTNAVRVLNVRTGCGCTTTALSTNLVMPGQTTEIMVSFDLKGRFGPQRKSVYLELDDPASPRLRLELSGISLAPIEVRPEGMHFGTLARDGDAVREVLLSAQTGVTFRVKEAKASSDAFTVQVEPREEGRLYALKIRSVGPRLDGTTHATIEAVTDHPAMPAINIPVTVFVAADVVAAPTSLILVQGATNVMRTYYVGVYSPAQKPFKVLAVESPGAALTCAVTNVSPGRHRIEIRALGELSDVNGKAIRIETDVDSVKELKVPVRVIAGPGAEVRTAK